MIESIVNLTPEMARAIAESNAASALATLPWLYALLALAALVIALNVVFPALRDMDFEDRNIGLLVISSLISAFLFIGVVTLRSEVAKATASPELYGATKVMRVLSNLD